MSIALRFSSFRSEITESYYEFSGMAVGFLCVAHKRSATDAVQYWCISLHQSRQMCIDSFICSAHELGETIQYRNRW